MGICPAIPLNVIFIDIPSSCFALVLIRHCDRSFSEVAAFKERVCLTFSSGSTWLVGVSQNLPVERSGCVVFNRRHRHSCSSLAQICKSLILFLLLLIYTLYLVVMALSFTCRGRICCFAVLHQSVRLKFCCILLNCTTGLILHL